jgi:hypothetical protein
MEAIVTDPLNGSGFSIFFIKSSPPAFRQSWNMVR